VGDVEAVIFDLGNVLVFHDNALLYRRLGERAGISGAQVAAVLADHTLFEGTNRGRLDAEGIRREVCRALGIDLGMEEFAPLWSCHFAINDAVLPLVEGLVGRVKLLLLSNTNALHTAYLRPRLPVLERFDHLLFSSEVGLIKPEPAFYQEALTRARVAATGAAFFDDHPPFVEAARTLGIRGYVFRDTDEFTGHLRQLGLDPAS
jgi:FMN phosphatase YigB (HAD superfamily)